MKISKSEAERLVISYKDFVEQIVSELKNKHPSPLESDELFQEGIGGLLKAVNESSSWKEFSGRVDKKICDEIETAIRVELYSARLGIDLRTDFVEYRKVRAALFKKLRRSPTLDEIAAKTTLPNEKLEGLENLYQTALGYEEQDPASP